MASNLQAMGMNNFLPLQVDYVTESWDYVDVTTMGSVFAERVPSSITYTAYYTNGTSSKIIKNGSDIWIDGNGNEITYDGSKYTLTGGKLTTDNTWTWNQETWIEAPEKPFYPYVDESDSLRKRVKALERELKEAKKKIVVPEKEVVNIKELQKKRDIEF